MGAEAASLGELELARKAGFSTIVYDSPTKTLEEIKYALGISGVLLNADNLEELELIADVIALGAGSDGDDDDVDGGGKGYSVGLRINTQVGSGSISELSTSSETAKFGTSLTNYREAILAAFRRHTFLDRLHVHTGSQGCSSDLLVSSASTCVSLAREINESQGEGGGGGRVISIDIGGGVPLDYGRDDDHHSVESNPFQDYAVELQKSIPKLEEFQIITEFGRSITGKCSFAASRVEYTKYAADRRIVTQHLGADSLLRSCYLPSSFPVRIFSCDVEGRALEGDSLELAGGDFVSTDVAGPLCFSGDLIARDRLLPKTISRGDLIIVPDVGAYTLSMFSRYNSRFFPAVWGFRGSSSDSEGGGGGGGGGNFTFQLFRKPETLEDIVQFWSSE